MLRLLFETERVVAAGGTPGRVTISLDELSFAKLKTLASAFGETPTAMARLLLVAAIEDGTADHAAWMEAGHPGLYLREKP